ncbi:hypothetical protein QUB80_33585 [Chlorogloeopsis sp. ULAP01]|uniref:hypothetical protein n=1 Tax=Chlorogloeopsis sp. ULAP01 TaxID=3056483 RepID=UPI0025AB3718|nr:hypothetical protein [Chlorogloeopsis sp. ULAP01]MDM9385590.1 hypothetical protein [Chlorogloeopsis sp. ULAP01]
MLLSTFELLVKPQLPPGLPNVPAEFENLSRTVIQGYFLTLANTINSDVLVSLVFTAVTPELDLDKTITFLDTGGDNIIGDLSPFNPNKKRFTIPINANDTVLFILQPDIIRNNGELINEKNFEVRGYVEIFVSALSNLSEVTLLVTPEHRGTFFKDLAANPPQLDQIAYSLPTATGSSLFKLESSPL